MLVVAAATLAGRQPARAFGATCGVIVLFFVTLFADLFPYTDGVDHERRLQPHAQRAASSRYTLSVMTVVAVLLRAVRPALPGLDLLGLPPSGFGGGLRRACARRSISLAGHGTGARWWRARRGLRRRHAVPGARLGAGSRGSARRRARTSAATVALGLVSTALVVAQATLARARRRTRLPGRRDGGRCRVLAVVAGGGERRPRPGCRGFRDGRALRRRARHGRPARAASCAICCWRAPATCTTSTPGELAATTVQGVDSLEAYFARYVPQAILAVLRAARDPHLGPAARLGVRRRPRRHRAPDPVFMVLIGLAAEQRTRRRWRVLAALGARFLDVVSGLETLRAFGRERAAARAIDEAGERYRHETMATLRVGLPLGTRARAAGDAGHGARRGHGRCRSSPSGSLALEAGLTVLILAPELYAPLRELGAQYHAGADGLACAERILEVLDAPAGVDGARAGARCPRSGAAPVTLTDVASRTPGAARPILDGVQPHARAGAHHGARRPQRRGQDDGGEDRRAPRRPAVRDGRLRRRGPGPRRRARVARARRVGGADPDLFAGTVEDNVRLARPGASSHEVAHALGQAGADGGRRRPARRRAHARRRRRATARPPASRGASPWRAPFSTTPRSSCSTSRPRTWIRSRRPRSRPPSRAWPRAARCCSSPTGPSWPPTATAVVELRDGRVAARESAAEMAA